MNRGIIRNHCQKSLSVGSYFIMKQLIEEDNKLNNGNGGTKWDQKDIEGRHRRSKDKDWEDDQDYTSRSSIQSFPSGGKENKDSEKNDAGGVVEEEEKEEKKATV